MVLYVSRKEPLNDVIFDANSNYYNNKYSISKPKKENLINTLSKKYEDYIDRIYPTECFDYALFMKPQCIFAKHAKVLLNITEYNNNYH